MRNFEDEIIFLLELIAGSIFIITLTILLAKYGLWLIKILNIL